MLSVARAESGKARYLRGEAERTGLPGASVDLVTAAQSFHWFDTTRALTEFERILRPDGWCAVFWNIPTMTPFQIAYRDVIQRYCDTIYKIRPMTGDAAASIRVDPRVRGLVESTFGTLQQFDAEGLLGRAHSSSYVPLSLGDDAAKRAAFDADMRCVFAEHQQGGVVNFPYECRALAWQFGGER
jgi:ubiquinone/menaquinone biosynthesis C-methylase UbiE